MAILIFSYCKKEKKEEVEIVKKSTIIGFNQNWSLLPPLTQALMSNTLLLKPQMIRYPGGTITYSWDWRTGIKIGGNPLLTHPVEDLKTLQTNTNVQYGFVPDILNKTIDDQVEMLSAIQNLGIKIGYIELGNELYLPQTDFVTAFPSGTEYAAKANIWMAQLKNVFPKAKISVALQCRDDNSVNARLNEWNEKVIAAINNTIDAYTYHVYIQPGGNFAARKKDFEDVVNTTNTGNKELWITEYGNQNDTTEVNYYRSLDSLADYIENYPKVTIALNHLISGSIRGKISKDGNNFTTEGKLFLTRAEKRK
ncbi:MAG: hypothetical protein IPH58_12300 [Sphingobacteriales bacterium]|nr:hypothetical protein [Sphingobacteriales bacterium]